MFGGSDVVAALKDAGVTHVVWIPDSDLGAWDATLSGPDGIPLIRVCREGEAFAIAAGLWIGGQKPIIVIQCTGLFEAGDSMRNMIHDMGVPLFTIVGERSGKAYRTSTTTDTCPVFAEPILNAWKIPFRTLDDSNTVEDLIDEYRQAQAENRAGAVLIQE